MTTDDNTPATPGSFEARIRYLRRVMSDGDKGVHWGDAVTEARAADALVARLRGELAQERQDHADDVDALQSCRAKLSAMRRSVHAAATR